MFPLSNESREQIKPLVARGERGKLKRKIQSNEIK